MSSKRPSTAFTRSASTRCKSAYLILRKAASIGAPVSARWLRLSSNAPAMGVCTSRLLASSPSRTSAGRSIRWICRTGNAWPRIGAAYAARRCCRIEELGLGGGGRDAAGAENHGDPGLAQEVVILRRDRVPHTTRISPAPPQRNDLSRFLLPLATGPRSPSSSSAPPPPCPGPASTACAAISPPGPRSAGGIPHPRGSRLSNPVRNRYRRRARRTRT